MPAYNYLSRRSPLRFSGSRGAPLTGSMSVVLGNVTRCPTDLIITVTLSFGQTAVTFCPHQHFVANFDFASRRHGQFNAEWPIRFLCHDGIRMPSAPA